MKNKLPTHLYREVKKVKNLIKVIRLKIDLPTMYDAKFIWIHPEDIDHTDFGMVMVIDEQLTAWTHEELRDYRQFMLLAGYAPRFTKLTENKSFYRKHLGTWVYNGKKKKHNAKK